jgi:hypothetical protein
MDRLHDEDAALLLKQLLKNLSRRDIISPCPCPVFTLHDLVGYLPLDYRLFL